MKDFFIVFNNFRDYFPLHNLGRIPAYDPDINDTLSYSFIEGNAAELLILNKKTGEISLSSNLNTNRQIQAELKVCVTGRFSKSLRYSYSNPTIYKKTKSHKKIVWLCLLDGVNTECAICTLTVLLVTEQMLLNSATLRIKDATADSFLTPISYSRLVEALASTMPTNKANVAVFSVKQDTEVLDALVLNISFSIRKSNGDQWIR